MAESHTKRDQRHYRITAAAGRPAMASDGLPFKPYAYKGGDREPATVTAARDRHRAMDADLERRRARAAAAVAGTAGPDIDDAGYEWRREQLLEDGGEWIIGGAAEAAEADAARGRYQEAQAALDAPPEPAPAPPPGCGSRALPPLQVPDHLGRAQGDVR